MNFYRPLIQPLDELELKLLRLLEEEDFSIDSPLNI